MTGRRPLGEGRRWGAVLLAAGQSTRMGAPKTRLEWRGTDLLSYQVTALAAAGADPIVAVVPPGDCDLVRATAGTPELHAPKVMAVPNPHPERGKTESIRLGVSALGVSAHGVSALGPCDAILLAAIDQPRDPALLDRLIDAHFRLGQAITVPIHRNRRGHPVVFVGELRSELLTVSEETLGLRGIVQADAARVAEWQTEDPSVRLEFNTPEEYECARRAQPWDEGPGVPPR